MPKSRTPSGRRSGNNLSGQLAFVSSTIADRLLLTSALSANGAILKMLFIPFFRLLARFFRWWSKGWLGQVLGFGWTKQTYQASAKQHVQPTDIGNEWPQYQHGNIKLQRPPKSR